MLCAKFQRKVTQLKGKETFILSLFNIVMNNVRLLYKYNRINKVKC